MNIVFFQNLENTRFYSVIFLFLFLAHIPTCTTGSYIINDEIIMSSDSVYVYKLQLQMRTSRVSFLSCQETEHLSSEWIFVPERTGVFNTPELHFADVYSDKYADNSFRSMFRGKVELSEDSVQIFLEFAISDYDTSSPKYFEYIHNGKYKLVHSNLASKPK